MVIRTDIQREVPLTFELKYPELDFRRVNGMEALLTGLNEGDYLDADVRAAFKQHINQYKNKKIKYWFDDLNLTAKIAVVDV